MVGLVVVVVDIYFCFSDYLEMDSAIDLPCVGRRGRDTLTDYAMCIICQRVREPNHLSSASKSGVNIIKERTLERQKYHDDVFLETLDRLEVIDFEKDKSHIVYHRQCYVKFTNIETIRRLKKRFEKNLYDQNPSEHDASVETETCSSERATRQSSVPMEWNKCLFCQEVTTEQLSAIQTLPTSEKILHLAQNDHVLCHKVAGLNDLISKGGKYHLKCYSKFVRKYSKTDQSTKTDNDKTEEDVCFIQVMEELRRGLGHWEVYSLRTVWDRYCKVQLESNAENGVYRSNRFKERIQNYLGPKLEFVHPLKPTEPLLLFPPMTTDVAANLLEHTIDTQNPLQGVMNHATKEVADVDTELLSWLYRVSIKINADLKATSGHDFIGGIDNEHMQKVVPESLYLLLCLICGGDKANDMRSEGKPSEIHNKVMSIAQDIVFVASSGKKKTPKHIG